MTELKQAYRCNVCGNMVEMVRSGKGELVCCGQPMQLMVPQTTETAYEKHVPVIVQRNGAKITVRVGATPHPMMPEHFIEWIELITEDRVLRQHLKPGEEPVAEFLFEGDTFRLREFCNLHGLWEAKIGS